LILIFNLFRKEENRKRKKKNTSEEKNQRKISICRKWVYLAICILIYVCVDVLCIKIVSALNLMRKFQQKTQIRTRYLFIVTLEVQSFRFQKGKILGRGIKFLIRSFNITITI